MSDGAKNGVGRGGVVPPVKTRFAPGHPGNPLGTRPGRKLVTAMLAIGKTRDRTPRLAETLDRAMACGFIVLDALDEVTRARIKKAS